MATKNNTIDIKGHELYLLERILNRQQSSDIKNHFTKSDIIELSDRYLFPKELIPNLETKGLIYYSGEHVYITDLAKDSLEHKYKKERNLINEHILDNYEYAFLEFMHNRNEPVPDFHFPIEFQIHSKIHMVPIEGVEGRYTEWKDEIYKYIEAPNVYGYLLNSLGKSRFEKLKKENDLKVNKENLEMQKLKGDVDKLTNELIDYSGVKSRLFRTEVIAVLSVGLAFLNLIAQLKGCK